MSAEETRPNDQPNDASTSESVEPSAQDAPEVLTGAADAPPPDAAAPDLEYEAEAEKEEDLLEAQLEQAQARADEYLDSLQRERASFQNFRKRVERERQEIGRVAARNLLLKLLPVLDDFHRAMDAVPEDERDEWFEGVVMIRRKFERLLEEEGVTEIDAFGAEFDPNFHEAVGIDPDTDADSGTITEVLLRGYKYGDSVLRPAMVRVAG
ncbi:MAG: nucleotide exchange factor GrpE [Anaerolineae bacterium]|nr:nucleotide exchange factor GrpE [Anaerolineae bacterium]